MQNREKVFSNTLDDALGDYDTSEAAVSGRMYVGNGYTNAGSQQLTHEHMGVRPITRKREDGCASTCTCMVRS